MPLLPNSLASSLENDWLAKENGSFPDSTSVSADRFATAFANWFGGAIAGPGAVTTAAARKSQLASLAIPALSAQSAQAAGSQLAQAIAAYIAGQVFGAGVAGPPIATAAAGSQIGSVFADLNSAPSARAQQIASACLTLATSTIVTFPPPTPPAPVS
ncbi:MAG TPA: hypothetical protein VGJ91_22600 [Polyangiaceae bacterium]|jgi:hypothetical protein